MFDDESIGSRFDSAMAKVFGTKRYGAMLAKEYGVTVQAVNKFKKNRKLSDTMRKIAIDKGVSPVWLEYGHGDMFGGIVSNSDTVAIPVISESASAGIGSNIDDVSIVDTGKTVIIDKSILNDGPTKNLRAIEISGDSMIPVLFPGNWVIFEEGQQWIGDGLYILIFRNVLMVKIVEANPSSGKLTIKSANSEYSSWEYDPTEDQSTFQIVGRVVRRII